MKRFMKSFRPVYDNTLDALVPEFWANEGISLLVENMVGAGLVYRDYENVVADMGDTVNSRLPASFSAKRKGANDNITIQDASVTNVPVVLNQHIHTSFLLRDSQISMSLKSLTAELLQPAIVSIASGVDKALLGFVPDFIGASTVGQLDGLTSSNVVSTILQARSKQNTNKLPLIGRNFLISPTTEAEMLELELFTAADKVGDEGTALREASLGRKLGYNFFMAQNVSSIQTGICNTRAGAVNNVGGYAIGTTSITMDGFSAAITAGSYVTIAGSMFPYIVQSTTGGATPTAMVITPALRDAVVNDAVITVYDPILVDLAAGYAAGYVKEIHVDGFGASDDLQIGQILRDASGNVYTIMEITNNTGTECDVLLNKPLVAQLANDAVLGVGPGGSYNFGFVKEALALVNRPLALPAPGFGVKAAVVNMNNVALRVVMSYDPDKQGTLITIDTLFGVKVLDTNRGIVMLG